MIVHFSASARNIENDITRYRLITHAIRQRGHSIAHDWIETALLMAQRKLEWDLDEIVSEVAAGIDMAELVIIEASNSSTFGVGYELALALQRKKPVLALIDEDVKNDSYAASLRHDLLTVRTYNMSTVEEIVNAFLDENTISIKDLRFNFVVDRRIYNHLRSKSYRLGKTKAEILRDLLLEDIERNKL